MRICGVRCFVRADVPLWLEAACEALVPDNDCEGVMSKKAKLIAQILANPANVRYDDACKVAQWLGFEAKGGKGSHAVFVHPTGLMLNFQNRQGLILAYQADQLARIVEQLRSETEE